MQDDKQSVEFFKIKLMEKESELKNLQAKLKKIDFKHSRDIKELKISEERAKDLLKKEKTKLDKITKQAKEHQEQNTLLQHRLTQLKEEKEKEIQNTRNKYNAIKQQVRSYQRILPTHTFLTEIGAQIDQLPTYQDIFNNFKQKSFMYDNLLNKHQQLKQQMQERKALMQKKEQELNGTIMQKERGIKELLGKVFELEGQVNEYKGQLHEMENRVVEVGEEVGFMRHRVQELQCENRQLLSEMQQLIQQHNTQLQQKQQQLHQQTQSQLRRYQQQLQQLHTRSDTKQQSYMHQISIYQQQVNQLQLRLQKQKQRHEQNYQEIKQVMEMLKGNLQSDRRTIEELKMENGGLRQDLFASSKALEKLQLQLYELKRDKQQTQHQLRQTQSQHDLHTTQLNQKDLAKRQLQYKLQQMAHQISMLHEDNRVKQQDNLALINQIEDLKYRLESSSGVQYAQRLALAQHIEIVEENRRRNITNQSMEGAKSEEKYQQYFTSQLLENNNQRRERQESFAVSEQLNHNELMVMREAKQQLQAQLISKTQQLSQALAKINLYEQKLQAKQLQLATITTQLTAIVEKLKILQSKQSKLKQDCMQLNKAVKGLQSENEQLRSNQSTLRKKYQAAKSTIQNLTAENNTIKTDVKKQKQAKQSLLQQIKQLKAKQSQQSSTSDKLTRQLNQRIKQLTTKHTTQQKAKNQLILKQKSHISQLTNLKQQTQKLVMRIKQLEMIGAENSQQLEEAVKVNKQLKKNNDRLRYEVGQLEEDNQQKDREIEMINQSLARERKERTLITVPSLQSLQADQEYQQEENFKQHYNTIGQKQGQIYMLQREVSNLKQQLQELKLTHKAKMQSIQIEQNEYIQQIIAMKLKVANSEMRAMEKEHLYNQLKKKQRAIEKNKKEGQVR